MSRGPRRIVANLLLMSAFRVGNPVEKFILILRDHPNPANEGQLKTGQR